MNCGVLQNVGYPEGSVSPPQNDGIYKQICCRYMGKAAADEADAALKQLHVAQQDLEAKKCRSAALEAAALKLRRRIASLCILLVEEKGIIRSLQIPTESTAFGLISSGASLYEHNIIVSITSLHHQGCQRRAGRGGQGCNDAAAAPAS